MTVYLGTVNKKVNSTFRPHLSTTVSANLKNNCDMINPIIVFNNDTYTSYNYLYFTYGSKTRYYFIDKWAYENHMWTAYCSIDVLASWKDAIAYTYMYILRSSNTRDNSVIDTLYPPTDEILSTTVTANMPWVSSPSNISNWYVIIAELMRPANIAGLAWQVFGPDQNSTITLNDFMSDLFTSWTATLSDPSPYLRTCFAVPYRPSHQAGLVQTLRWGGAVYGEVTGSTGLNSAQEHFSFSMDVPDNQYHGTIGNWIYHEPYSRYVLNILPWGVFTLDSYELAVSDNINIDIYCDNLTGQALLIVKSGYEILVNSTIQLGVPIDLSGTRLDATQLLGAVGSIASAAVSKNPAVAAAAFGNALGSGVNTLVGDAISIGGTGGTLGIFSTCSLTRIYCPPADNDSPNNGYPLCQLKRPVDIPGFIIAQKGLVSTEQYKIEQDMINRYMEEGFYYE